MILIQCLLFSFGNKNVIMDRETVKKDLFPAAASLGNMSSEDDKLWIALSNSREALGILLRRILLLQKVRLSEQNKRVKPLGHSKKQK